MTGGASEPSRTSPLVKVSLALWAVLALAVFSIIFDAKTRAAGFAFVTSQTARRAQGAPLDTIDHGFRPRLRAAALESAPWGVLILTGGVAATLVARRATILSESKG